MSERLKHMIQAWDEEQAQDRSVARRDTSPDETVLRDLKAELQGYVDRINAVLLDMQTLARAGDDGEKNRRMDQAAGDRAMLVEALMTYASHVDGDVSALCKQAGTLPLNKLVMLAKAVMQEIGVTSPSDRFSQQGGIRPSRFRT